MTSYLSLSAVPIDDCDWFSFRNTLARRGQSCGILGYFGVDNNNATVTHALNPFLSADRFVGFWFITIINPKLNWWCVLAWYSGCFSGDLWHFHLCCLNSQHVNMLFVLLVIGHSIDYSCTLILPELNSSFVSFDMKTFVVCQAHAGYSSYL